MRLSELKLLGIRAIQIISEGYGRSLKMNYQNFNVDPQPTILKLGTWEHPNTGNTLIGGINLNYLTHQQIERLRYYLPEILKSKNLKRRYWTGRRLLGDIFNNKGYRTYDQKHVDIIEPGTLRFMQPAELAKLGAKEKADRLGQRRAHLTALRAEPPKKRVPTTMPLPGELPPEAELELPEKTPGQAPAEVDTAQRAKMAVDAARAHKNIERKPDEKPTPDIGIPEPEPDIPPDDINIISPDDLGTIDAPVEPTLEVPEEPIEEPEISEPDDISAEPDMPVERPIHKRIKRKPKEPELPDLDNI